MSKKSPLVFNIFKVQTDNRYTNLILVCNFVHTMMAFFEPQLLAHFETRVLVSVLHAFFILVYVSDVAMKMYYQGREEYFSKGWQSLYATAITLLVLDWMWNLRTSFTSPFRPIVLTLRSRAVRRFFTVIKKMIPGFIHICVPMAFFLLVMSIVGVVLFHDFDDVYQDPKKALYSLWILMMNTETYTDLSPAEGREGISYATYFFVVLLVGNLLLVSLLLGVTFDVFIEHTKSQLKSERLKEVKGLVKAFTHMDRENKGTMSRTMWMRFLGYLKPELTEFEKAMYFELASSFNDDIDIISFLELRKVLSYHFVARSTEERPPILESLDTFTIPMVSNWKSAAEQLLKPLHRIVVYINLVDCIALCVGLQGVDISLLGLGLTVSDLIQTIYILEILSILSVNDGNFGKYRETLKLGDTIYLFGLVGTAFARFLPADRWAMLFVLARCARLVNLNKDLYNYCVCLWAVLPIFAQTISFGLIIAYGFAFTGHAAFSTEHFSTPTRSMLTMLQLFFNVDFYAVAEATVQAHHPIVLVFFFVYYVIGVLIVSNLINSIIIQFYSDSLNEKSLSHLQEEEESERSLEESLISRIRQKRVLAFWGKSGVPDFASMKMEKHSLHRDIRSRLGFGQDAVPITKDDLKKCQKYAKVDLVRKYEEYKGGAAASDVASLSRLLKKTGKVKQETILPGETIYKRGDASDSLYIIEYGSVSIMLDDREVTRRGAGQMFGYNGLHVPTPRQEDVMAISETEVLVLTRKAFLEEIPADTHVSITRMVAVLLDTDKAERQEFVKRVPSPPPTHQRKDSRPAMLVKSVSMNNEFLNRSPSVKIQKVPSADSVEDDSQSLAQLAEAVDNLDDLPPAASVLLRRKSSSFKVKA